MLPIPAPLLDLLEVPLVGVERVVVSSWDQAAEGILASRLWNLSKAAPNWLACQLEVISNLHRVRIITDQKAAVVL